MSSLQRCFGMRSAGTRMTRRNASRSRTAGAGAAAAAAAPSAAPAAAADAITRRVTASARRHASINGRRGAAGAGARRVWDAAASGTRARL